MKSRIFFCLQCSKGTLLLEELNCDCRKEFKVDGMLNITLNRTRWRRFVSWVYRFDISSGLAFMGVVIINVLLLPHFNLSFTESLLESFCIGLIAQKLMK